MGLRPCYLQRGGPATNNLVSYLALSLLVARLGVADNPQYTLATHNFAVTADLFYRSAYFHDLTSINQTAFARRA
jgi:hypothetical protein